MRANTVSANTQAVVQVSRGSMSEPLPPEMSPQISYIYSAMLESIRVSKRRQWAITNYSVLIYAGLFGLAKNLTGLNDGEKKWVVVLTVITFVCTSYLLIRIQRDLGRYRKMSDRIHNRWMTGEQRKVTHRNPALRGASFLIGLIGVTAIGALIVGYAVLR
jgi:hypothetical protein